MKKNFLKVVKNQYLQVKIEMNIYSKIGIKLQNVERHNLWKFNMIWKQSTYFYGLFAGWINIGQD